MSVTNIYYYIFHDFILDKLETVNVLDGKFSIQKLCVLCQPFNGLTSLQADKTSASSKIRGKHKHVHHSETVSFVERYRVFDWLISQNNEGQAVLFVLLQLLIKLAAK